MPYTIVKQGEQYCIHKMDMNGKPHGASMGCHPSHKAALQQVKAIYANEKTQTKKK